MKVVLLNPRLRTWSPNMWVPLGLAYVAAALEQAGHGVSILDLNATKVPDRQLVQRLNGADVVGITGMITEYQEVVRLARLIKQGASATVVLGGALATTMPRELLAASSADFAVVGEGERTVVALLNSLSKEESPAGIDGIAYRTGSDILLTGRAAPIADVDSIPLPARHLLDMKLYLKDHFRSFGLKTGEVGKIRSTNLITSRGCPYSCTFCFKEMWGSKWRGRSPESILAEMASLHETYGVNGFYFNDDTFVLDRDRVLRFCRLLQERGLKAIWYCNGRVNLMSQDMLREMYRAGCRGIAYGIESGNQQVLDSMRKNIKLDQVRQVIEWTKGAGINVTGYFMIGMLGETKDTIRETIAFARELQLDFYGFSITTPLPGTELFETSLGNGLISGDLDHLGEWSLHANSNLTQDCSLDDLRSFASEAFREFTVRKRFGKYYMLRPDFALAALKILLAVRGVEQAREVAGKARGLLASYWSKPEA